jgi:hypothetical protein
MPWNKLGWVRAPVSGDLSGGLSARCVERTGSIAAHRATVRLFHADATVLDDAMDDVSALICRSFTRVRKDRPIDRFSLP